MADSKPPKGISLAACAKRAAVQGAPYRGTITVQVGPRPLEILYEIDADKNVTMLTEGVTPVILRSYGGIITRWSMKGCTRVPH